MISRAVRYSYNAPVVSAVPPGVAPFFTSVETTKFHAVQYWGIHMKCFGRTLTVNNNVLTQV